MLDDVEWDNSIDTRMWSDHLTRKVVIILEPFSLCLIQVLIIIIAHNPHPMQLFWSKSDLDQLVQKLLTKTTLMTPGRHLTILFHFEISSS